MLSITRTIRAALLVCVGAVGVGPAAAQGNEAAGEWRYFGGDRAFTRYAPLDQVHRGNVAGLRVLWRRPSVDASLTRSYPDLGPRPYLLANPIMVDGVLYAPNGVGLLEAFDPGTGRTLWVQEPFAPEEAAGRSSRGADYWGDGGDRRLLVVRGEHLYAVEAGTGRPVRSFGEEGRVRLRPDGAERYHWTSGPIVVGDVVVVAGNNDGAGDGGSVKEATPEHVRGFDVRTGRLAWTFHVVPQEGEFGVQTWENEAWRYSGDLGSWCCLSADEELGYVFVPLTAPTSASYGGHRPGDNLFSNTLVALDARTGERAWHFQMVRHDLWEYDNVGPPILGDITVDGRRIPAVMQANKNAFVYVLDRRTGEPVWPIVDRPVPRSSVPGERASPTQPFPTKPAPFDRQGITVDDLVDFTPELRARALEMVRPFVLGSLYTPPSLSSDDESGTAGTLTIPGGWGAANWHTGAFDPETGFYYAISHTLMGNRGVARTTEPEATMAYAGRGSPIHPTPNLDGLPIVKPPWGRITAIDMNRGEHVWMAANGDGPRDHPLLKDLDLPPLGVANRPAALVTRSLLFIGEGSDAVIGTSPLMWGKKFRAYDKATGAVIWETELDAGVTGQPMTYLHGGKQFIVVPIGGREHPAEWVALGLP